MRVTVCRCTALCLRLLLLSGRWRAGYANPCYANASGEGQAQTRLRSP